MNTKKTYGIRDEIWYYVMEEEKRYYRRDIIRNVILFLIFYERLTTVNIALIFRI